MPPKYVPDIIENVWDAAEIMLTAIEITWDCAKIPWDIAKIRAHKKSVNEFTDFLYLFLLMVAACMEIIDIRYHPAAFIGRSTAS